MSINGAVQMTHSYPEVEDVMRWLADLCEPRYLEGRGRFGDPRDRGDAAYYLQQAAEEGADLMFYLRQVERLLGPGPNGELRIYVAGPYTASTRAKRETHIRAARDAGAALRRLGHWPFVLHIMTAHWEDIYPDISWASYIAWLVAWLVPCHAILMLPGWEGSNGACIEHGAAARMGKRTFYNTNEVPDVRPARDADDDALRRFAAILEHDALRLARSDGPVPDEQPVALTEIDETE